MRNVWVEEGMSFAPVIASMRGMGWPAGTTAPFAGERMVKVTRGGGLGDPADRYPESTINARIRRTIRRIGAPLLLTNR